MCKLGVVACDGMPAFDPRLHDVIAACPPAQLAHQNVTLAPSPMNHERSRFQGKAGHASSNARDARLSDRLQVLARACSGAIAHVTNAADGCRTTRVACRAGEWTLVHHAVGRCVADMCRKAGLNSEEEVVILELHEKAHDGTVKEARMDAVVSRPGGLQRWMIDVRTVDGKSATAIALGGSEGAFRSGEQEKQRRYQGRA